MAEDVTTPPASSDGYDADERKRKADLAKPMAAAPIKYNDDGSVAWGDMWDSFCVLATAGGPPHRGTMLMPDESSNPDSETYRAAQAEIIRGIYLVSGLTATPDRPGWIAVECPDEAMAAWIADNGSQENVYLRWEGTRFYVPCGERYTIKGEVKNVVTVVAKTTHYWADHLSSDVRATMAVEAGLSKVAARIKGLFSRKAASAPSQ